MSVGTEMMQEETRAMLKEYQQGIKDAMLANRENSADLYTAAVRAGAGLMQNESFYEKTLAMLDQHSKIELYDRQVSRTWTWTDIRTDPDPEATCHKAEVAAKQLAQSIIHMTNKFADITGETMKHNGNDLMYTAEIAGLAMSGNGYRIDIRENSLEVMENNRQIEHLVLEMKDKMRNDSDLMLGDDDIMPTTAGSPKSFHGSLDLQMKEAGEKTASTPIKNQHEHTLDDSIIL